MSKLKRRASIRRTQPPRAAIRPNGRSTAPASWQARLGVALVILSVVGGSTGLAFFLWQSGWVVRQGQALVQKTLDISRRAGFAVTDIVVEGGTPNDKGQILAALELQKGQPILAFDPRQALQKLQTIPWVQQGVVERRLPGTIYITLKSRTPFAIWQYQNQLKLIDAQGHVLRGVGLHEKLALPHVVGAGAQTEAASLFTALADNAPAVAAMLQTAVRVSERRWDLHMPGNIVVKLPEEHMEAALKRLNSLVTDQAILQRNIIGLDLRLPDRMIVETDQPIDAVKPGKTPPHS